MIDAIDCQLIAAVQGGLPLSPRPYLAVAERLGISEQHVIDRLEGLKQQGLIKRWGVVVKHRQLGYQANAMIVIDVPDDLVDQIGQDLSRQHAVNLCYQRPRQGNIWPYNLYCMIHGKNRDCVLKQWHAIRVACGLQHYAFEVLFSQRCFKQRGALYGRQSEAVTVE